MRRVPEEATSYALAPGVDAVFYESDKGEIQVGRLHRLLCAVGHKQARRQVFGCIAGDNRQERVYVKNTTQENGQNKDCDNDAYSFHKPSSASFTKLATVFGASSS